MRDFLPYITPIAGAIVVILGAISLYLNNRAKNVQSYATGWQGYAKKLEERITILEKKDTDRETQRDIERKQYEITLDAKDKRISELEIRVDYLEEELKKTQNIEAKVEDTKAVLHQTVESEMNNLKQ